MSRSGHAAYMKEYRTKHPEKWSTQATRSIRLRHYYKHKERLLAQSKRRRVAMQEEIDLIKWRPCMDCGGIYPPYVMDFDHVRGKKLFQVAGSLHRSRERVLAEVAKCDVVCSNCHRMRTFRHKEV